MLKRIVKSSFNILAANFGSHTKVTAEDRLWVMMYHRILPKQLAMELNEEPGMFVTPETFEHHLQWLQESMTPVRLQEWVADDAGGTQRSGNFFAITFDDGWRDNYQYAFPLLKKYDIPATIFLVTDLMGTNKLFWPNRLAKLTTLLADFNNPSVALRSLRNKLNIQTANDCSDVSDLIGKAKAYSDSELNILMDQIEEDLAFNNNSSQLLNWREIQAMNDSGLIDFGAHTRHHTRLLDSVAEDVIDDEVIGSKQTLEHRLGNTVELFCYPNGDYSDYSAQRVGEHYSAAVTTERGFNRREQDRHKLMRVGVHEDVSASKTDFLARLACWR